MKTNREYTPTPHELNKTFESLTLSQQFQFEAIMNMVIALLMAVQQTQMNQDYKKETEKV